MVKRTEEIKEVNEKKKDIFKTWEDSYTAISKIWDDSLKLYRIRYTGHGLPNWRIKSYGKVFDELLTLPFRQNIKDLFENIPILP
ncbi:MAG: hypothetical protein J5U17_02750 [Candidatus Methanoperedens sp.]|nr:hypothetical protein [Candidatus Methanoperedens sp.]